MPSVIPRAVALAAPGSPIRLAYTHKLTVKKRRQRHEKWARQRGVWPPPAWRWNYHEQDCPCYDCLYGATPWSGERPSGVELRVVERPTAVRYGS